MNVLSYGIKVWTDLSSVLSGITRVTDRQADGRTDGQTDRILLAIPRLHYMQRGKNYRYGANASHSVPVYSPAFAGTHYAYPGGMARLSYIILSYYSDKIINHKLTAHPFRQKYCLNLFTYWKHIFSRGKRYFTTAKLQVQLIFLITEVLVWQLIVLFINIEFM